MKHSILFFTITLFTTIYGIHAQERKAEIVIDQDSDLYHRPITIKAQNLPVNKRIVVQLEAIDAKAHSWKSETIYIADSNGMIDLNKQPSIGGSYLGIHPMGLFWSAILAVMFMNESSEYQVFLPSSTFVFQPSAVMRTPCSFTTWFSTTSLALK